MCVGACLWIVSPWHASRNQHKTFIDVSAVANSVRLRFDPSDLPLTIFHAIAIAAILPVTSCLKEFLGLFADRARRRHPGAIHPRRAVKCRPGVRMRECVFVCACMHNSLTCLYLCLFLLLLLSSCERVNASTFTCQHALHVLQATNMLVRGDY